MTADATPPSLGDGESQAKRAGVGIGQRRNDGGEVGQGVGRLRQVQLGGKWLREGAPSGVGTRADLRKRCPPPTVV
jgi:hypothetical protein